MPQSRVPALRSTSSRTAATTSGELGLLQQGLQTHRGGRLTRVGAHPAQRCGGPQAVEDTLQPDRCVGVVGAEPVPLQVPDMGVVAGDQGRLGDPVGQLQQQVPEPRLAPVDDRGTQPFDDRGVAAHHQVDRLAQVPAVTS